MRYYSILLISILISTGCSEEAQPPQQEKLQDLLVTVRRHKYLFFKGLARVATSGTTCAGETWQIYLDKTLRP